MLLSIPWAAAPIASTSRSIVRKARGEGYDVRYEEFDGAHTVPPQLAADAMAWFLAGPPQRQSRRRAGLVLDT